MRSIGAEIYSATLCNAEYMPYGIDISENAVEYVNDTLRVQSLCIGFFERINIKEFP